MTYALGIDPDTHDLAFGVWGPDGPEAAWVVHAPRAKGQSQVRMARELATLTWNGAWFITTAAIEGQQVDRRQARARDLFTLAHVTGMAALLVTQRCPSAQIIIPTPSEWKGGVAKHAMQARLYHDLGWGYEIIGGTYARPLHIPERFSHITAGQFKHVGDALLLARWAFNQ